MKNAPPPASSHPINKYWPALLLAVMTLWLFWPARDFDFINYDDPDYVTANPHVQAGLNAPDIKWALTHAVAGNWQPVTLWSHMLDCQLYKLVPRGHHLISVALHALNAALVFLFLFRLTGARWRSATVAALFALHPLRCESVAWISERKDVLSGFFGLLTLFFYAAYAQKKTNGKKALYVAALLCFVLGLMSKPMLVTWPFVMLLLDFWPLQRVRDKHLIIEKIPFFILSAVLCVVTLKTQSSHGAVADLGGLDFSARFGNALVSYCRYVEKIFWPSHLSIFYPHPGHWPGLIVCAAGIFLAGLSWLLFRERSRAPFLLTGWLWFLGVLFPVIGLMQAGELAIADRYTYLPCIGLIIATVWGFSYAMEKWKLPSLASAGVATVAALLCCGATRAELKHWPSSETVFSHALESTTNNYLAHLQLGNALRERGDIDDAIPHYREAIKLYSGYAAAHNNLAVLYVRKNQNDEAIKEYRAAIEANPNYTDARFNLAVLFSKMNRLDEAIAEFKIVVDARPEFALAHDLFGMTLDRKGDTAAAIQQLQTAIALKPDGVELHNNLGLILGKSGQIDAALIEFQTVTQLRPDNAGGHYNLGLAFKKKNRVEEALHEFQEALRLKPDYDDARNQIQRLQK